MNFACWVRSADSTASLKWRYFSHQWKKVLISGLHHRCVWKRSISLKAKCSKHGSFISRKCGSTVAPCLTVKWSLDAYEKPSSSEWCISTLFLLSAKSNSRDILNNCKHFLESLLISILRHSIVCALLRKKNKRSIKY